MIKGTCVHPLAFGAVLGSVLVLLVDAKLWGMAAFLAFATILHLAMLYRDRGSR